MPYFLSLRAGGAEGDAEEGGAVLSVLRSSSALAPPSFERSRAEREVRAPANDLTGNLRSKQDDLGKTGLQTCGFFFSTPLTLDICPCCIHVSPIVKLASVRSLSCNLLFFPRQLA